MDLKAAQLESWNLNLKLGSSIIEKAQLILQCPRVPSVYLPNEHEAQCPDVGWVCMCNQTIKLFSGQF